MKRMITQPIKKALSLVGYELKPIPKNTSSDLPDDFEEDEKEIVRFIRPYTLTSPERVVSMMRATSYVTKHQIPGSIVECGVWRGGSIMAAIKILLAHGDQSRDLYLYDTFEGMSEPTEHDVNFRGMTAASNIKKEIEMTTASLENVQGNIFPLGYPKEKTHFVQGKVEETIPQQIPEQISILRLDTDWYESTKHELEHLFPRLAVGGVLIIDDYGHWKGARKAVDEYLEENKVPLLMNRIDYTGRIAIKVKA